MVDGFDIRSGLINLFVYGKSYYEEDLIIVCVVFNFVFLKWSVLVCVKFYVILV